MNKLIEEAEEIYNQIDKAQVHLINARLQSDEEGISDTDKQIEDLRKALFYINDEIERIKDKKEE